MTRLRPLLLGLTLSLLLALSGCVAFLTGSPSATQTEVIGPVEIRSEVCASDKGEELHPGCDDEDVAGGDADGNGNTDAEDEDFVQVLVAYRVPTGSDGPETFVTDDAPGTSSLRFAKSPSYTRELQRVAPAPAGQHWVGYMSASFSYDVDPDSEDAHRLTFSPEFSLPQGPGGAPFRGPFLYRQILGARRSNDVGETTRPVVCAEDLAFAAENNRCTVAPSIATIPTNASFATRDFGLVPGAGEATVTAGKATGVAFDAVLAGAASGDAGFALTAASTVPGATAAPSRLELAPGANSSTPVAATVAVPRTTPPGIYSATLTAQLPNGQTRTATRSLRVIDATRPQASTRVVKGQTLRSLLRRGLRLRVELDEPARVTVELLGSSAFVARNVRLGQRSARYRRAGVKRVTVKLSKKARSRKARRRLLRKRAVRFVVRVKARDTSGNPRTTRKKIRLRR